jgi:hypothetical protein
LPDPGPERQRAAAAVDGEAAERLGGDRVDERGAALGFTECRVVEQDPRRVTGCGGRSDGGDRQVGAHRLGGVEVQPAQQRGDGGRVVDLLGRRVEPTLGRGRHA